MFDSFVIEKVCAELEARILNRRVQRISLLAKDRFAIKFGTKEYLVIDMSPQSYHISLRPDRPVDQSLVTGLYTGMRKHLSGARLLSVRQIDFDRTVEMRFGNLNSIMEPVELILYLEMMGRHANAILVGPDGLIIQALKFSDLEQHPIEMGMPYSPFAARKRDPFDADDDFTNALEYKGFTRALLRILPTEIKQGSIADVSRWILNSDRPSIYVADDRYRDYHIFTNDELALVETEDIFHAMNMYYAQQPDHSKTSQIANYRQLINSRLKQVEDKLHRLAETAREYAQAEIYKQQADILYANLYSIKPRQSVFEGYDFSNQPIQIELDPSQTATQNAQALYERYQKMIRGSKSVLQQQALARKEKTTLEQLLYDLENITQTSEVEEFEQVLIEQGIIKKTKKTSRSTKSAPLDVFYRDVKYTIGRNSYQNDQLVSKTSQRDFVWFHAKGIPGSHVVMHLPLSQADDDQLEYGAKLAAGYSKAGPGVKVEVDYVRIGQLKKPKGAPMGFVTFNGQTTVTVIGQKIQKL